MNIDPHPSYNDNPRNVKQDIENAKLTVTWKTKDGGNATLSADLDKASFLSVYPAADDFYKPYLERWGGIERMETPDKMGIVWTPKIGWSYRIQMEEPMVNTTQLNDFEKKALQEAAKDANLKLQRAKRREEEAREEYESLKKQTERALAKYNALSKYEVQDSW